MGAAVGLGLGLRALALVQARRCTSSSFHRWEARMLMNRANRSSTRRASSSNRAMRSRMRPSSASRPRHRCPRSWAGGRCGELEGGRGLWVTPNSWSPQARRRRACSGFLARPRPARASLLELGLQAAADDLLVASFFAVFEQHVLLEHHQHVAAAGHPDAAAALLRLIPQPSEELLPEKPFFLNEVIKIHTFLHRAAVGRFKGPGSGIPARCVAPPPRGCARRWRRPARATPGPPRRGPGRHRAWPVPGAPRPRPGGPGRGSPR